MRAAHPPHEAAGHGSVLALRRLEGDAVQLGHPRDGRREHFFRRFAFGLLLGHVSGLLLDLVLGDEETRADEGQCDVAENCTGSSANCPADGFEPNGTSCDDVDVCTAPDECQSGTCLSMSICGDGNLDLGCGEECDDNNNDDGDGCTGACIIEFCGDNVVNDAPNEQCDDGNMASGDGCDSTCQDEFCGDGIVNDSPNEDCDPPGGGGCSANEFCVDDCTCSGNIGSHKCVLDSSSGLVIHASLFPIVAPLTGSFDIDCGIVDPNTGKASCECLIQQINPFEISGLGFVCLSPSAATCPLGEIDCDGGNGLDLDVLSDHNIGACTGNPGCEGACTTYCSGLGKAVFDSGCEGFCEGGTSDGQSCIVDAGCPGGACNGMENVPHGNICGCSCVSQGGAPSRAGGLSCEIGTDIVLEFLAPCGDGDLILVVGSSCIPLTTESVTGLITNFNNVAMDDFPDPNGIGISEIGVPMSCDDLASSVTTGVQLVGAINFFGTTLGDLAVSLAFSCE